MPYTHPNSQLTLDTKGAITAHDHDDGGNYVGRRDPVLNVPTCSRVRPLLESSATTAKTHAAKKVVRFKEELENVRLFRKMDHPRAVGQLPPGNRCLPGKRLTATLQDASSVFVLSTGGGDSNLRCSATSRSPETNVYLEKVRLLGDATAVVGVVNVKNLAFEEHVTCRFTLDNWTTQSEVAADYLESIGSPDVGADRDSFRFSIPIWDYSHLGSNRLEFCIRYRVIDLEFWDNNNFTDFMVSFEVESHDDPVKALANSTDAPGETHTDTRRGREDASAIAGSSDMALRCNSAEPVRVGALRRRYNLSGMPSTMPRPDMTKKRNRVVAVMRTGPSVGGRRAIHQETGPSVIK
ncbi:protein phosphatase regulatory subunit Gac1 [Metarhizium acridum CQMa 102]|uniref:Protein phosphatase regulatory subunit Gac1 n=1 Tax=Metarhizium acridum (strain CQMa 102) TaxID=655827 RepID=E9EGN6_METAQ|nr:protein phosphatase regulatory subunit Gac1 [Metarhizium acridum CQMa 102]EFY84924.1 protein phosphatase regulatory subunit Gac1 [Metarhizium acridum CQMa 102]